MSAPPTGRRKRLRAALIAHQQRAMAARAARIVVAGYPHSHNPYVPHAHAEDCYAGCKHHETRP